MSSLMLVNVGLAVVGTLAALAMAGVYWKNHRAIRSPFTMGLLLFAAFLILHNGLQVYHFVTMMDAEDAASAWMLLAENVLQVGAVGALLAATMR